MGRRNPGAQYSAVYIKKSRSLSLTDDNLSRLLSILLKTPLVNVVSILIEMLLLKIIAEGQKLNDFIANVKLKILML
jgi:hypothetical protein